MKNHKNRKNSLFTKWLKSKAAIPTTILCASASIVAVTLLVTTVGVQSDEILNKYNNLSGRREDSKEKFGHQFFRIVVDENGNERLEIIIGNNKDNAGLSGVGDSDPGTPDGSMDGYGGGSEGNGNLPTPPGEDIVITPATDDVVIDGWLVLHKEPSGSGSVMSAPSNICKVNWSMGEGNTTYGSKYCRATYSDSSYSRPNIEGKTASEGIVDASGHYWVGVGPAWFGNMGVNSSTGYPNPPHSGSVVPSNVLGTSTGFTFDIVVNYEGNTYYIWAKLGDAKVHTFGSYSCKCGDELCGLGYSQSGTYHDGTESPSHRDNSLVEWCGVTGSVGAGLSSKMEFVGLAR